MEQSEDNTNAKNQPNIGAQLGAKKQRIKEEVKSHDPKDVDIHLTTSALPSQRTLQKQINADVRLHNHGVRERALSKNFGDIKDETNSNHPAAE